MLCSLPMEFVFFSDRYYLMLKNTFLCVSFSLMLSIVIPSNFEIHIRIQKYPKNSTTFDIFIQAFGFAYLMEENSKNSFNLSPPTSMTSMKITDFCEFSMIRETSN